jgi:hypothetical protein
MYNWLVVNFGKKYASLLIVIWYLLLIFLIVIFSGVPDTRFKYLGL